MNEDERNIRYSVYHGNDMLIDNEQMISVDDAVRRIYEVGEDIFRSQPKWYNFGGTDDDIPEDVVRFGPYSFALGTLLSDIEWAIISVGGDIWRVLTLQVNTDDDPIMPLHIALRRNHKGEILLNDIYHIHDTVEDVKHKCRYLYDGMLKEYDGDDIKLEIKDKHGNILCGKYGRVDEWVDRRG